MKKNIYFLSNKLVLLKLFIVSVFLLSVATTASAGTNVNKDKDNNKSASNVQALIEDVLRNTESSLMSVESNTWDSIQHVENALSSILKIKEELSPDTHVEAKSPLVVDNKREYWFMYPRVAKDTIYNEEVFPTLHSKYKSGIFYEGDGAGQANDEFAAYFDYPFAYASLLTARDALNTNKFKEAYIALKWVFEAIYLRPDFYVNEEHSFVQMDDMQINLKGEYPVVGKNQ